MVNRLSNWWSTLSKTEKIVARFIGLGIGILTFWGLLEDRFHAKKPEINTDLHVTYDEAIRVCQVDIRLVNLGDQTAIINQVSIEAIDSVRLGSRMRTPLDPMATILHSSGKYEIDLSQLHKKGSAIHYDISYSLTPNEVDQFSLRMAALSLPAGTSIIVPIQISLHTRDEIFKSVKATITLNAYLTDTDTHF